LLFNSYEYLIYFLPVAAIVYFAIGARAAWPVRWLVAASLFFYGFWNPRYIPLIAASIVVNFAIGRRISRAASGRRWLAAGVAGNVAALGVFKYSDFILRSLAGTGLVPLVQWHLTLPLGISFFTFTQIAFLVDVSRRKAQEPSFDNYALFVSFFPHLLAGPIIHHSEMMPQFASPLNKRLAWENVARGLFLLSIGLAKKVLVADPLVPLVSAGFDHAHAIGATAAWIAALAYALQIYFDFSGYTDMALGAALIFNIRLPINFDSPYRATDLRDFWHRWHITLSRFLREYLYIPLGGNRRSEPRVLLNLLVTFVLGGLWHGAAWTFVCWGAVHGLGLCCLRVWSRAGYALPRVAAWAVTFLFVTASWVFFRANSLDDAFAMLRAMAGRPAATIPGNAMSFEPIIDALIAQGPGAALAFAAGIALVFRRRNSNALVREISASPMPAFFTAAALVASVLQLAKVAPFLYFNF